MTDEIIALKTCPKCNTEKSRDLFSKNKSRPDGLSNWCRQCKSQDNARWRKSNQEYSKQYHKEHKELYRAAYACSEAAKENKRRYYQENKQIIVGRSLLWAKNNAAVAASRAMHRIALKIKATPGWVDHNLILQVYDRAKQLMVETGGEWHVDHIVPLKSKIVCGLHVQNNLEVLPASENIAKGNHRWPDMP